MSLTKFESMLKTNKIYFFDLDEFEEIIIHYLDEGKHALAKKALKLGLEQHPESIDLKFFQVELYLFDNEVDKAFFILTKIEESDPENYEVFTQRAIIYSKSGNHEEAIINLKKALTFTNYKTLVWSLMGMEYLYLNDFENALKNFVNCIDVDFEDYAALYNIIYCFDMEKEHTKAITYLNNYLNKNPYCEVAWHQLGRQFFILDDFEQALIAFDYAVLIDEHFIGGYLEKAKTLEALGKYQEAIDNYLVTLNLDDPTAFAFVRVGECYEKLHKYDAAISYYKKAVHEDPLLDRGWFLLANIYYDDKNYNKAAYYTAEALKIDEDNAVFWRRYAEIKMKLNFYEEAVTGFEKCLMLGDNAIEIYIALVDVLSFLGEFNDAITVLIDAQKTYKNFAEIEYRLAGLFFTLNKKKYGFNHLIIGLNLDYEYHTILKEIFPTVLDDKKVQKLIIDFKKTLE
ncbi:lipopolysaccharide assembly protein LapB [Polaribacter sp. Hel_I_88]|uniref:tetratricopeptide repeat protein n=1 Tax=Polaribacter sp. Hel_I_88 TaxID=1250006 RepID=UPI00047EC5B3|nr:tetratricopeptide repeat protein [Polaribacter sp. Hel_I_88]